MLRTLAGLLVVLSTGCTGCEGGTGVEVFHPDGTPLDLVPTADSGSDTELYELRVCAGTGTKVIASLWSGCGGTCYVDSTIVSLTVDDPAVRVSTTTAPDTQLEELRVGHALAVEADDTVAARLRIELESTGSDDRYRGVGDVLVIADACP